VPVAAQPGRQLPAAGAGGRELPVGQEPAPLVQDGCVVGVHVRVDPGDQSALIGVHSVLLALCCDRSVAGVGPVGRT
jgi:hypothetical protein